MILNIVERLMIGGLLPTEGGMVDLRVSQEAREAITVTVQEIEEWGVKDRVNADGSPGGVSWNPEAVTDKDVTLSTSAIGLITKAIKGMDEKKQLTPNHMSLYEKFVEAPNDSEEPT